jgi:glycosyltransferase involved in cell wall biosynthesis
VFGPALNFAFSGIAVSLTLQLAGDYVLNNSISSAVKNDHYLQFAVITHTITFFALWGLFSYLNIPHPIVSASLAALQLLLFQIPTIRKWVKRVVDELINAKLGLVAFSINFALVYWVNRDFGFAAAAWSGIKGGASAFFLGGFFGRMSERFSEMPNPWLAYPLGSVIPTILAYSIILPMHWLTGTPKPFLSTLLPMFQSMFINTPSTIFVLRRGFLRQNRRKPAVKDKIWLKRQERAIQQEKEGASFRQRKISLVVPTYWVAAEQTLELGKQQFDHPTVVGQESTLPALLHSLKNTTLEDIELIVVIASDSEKTQELVHKEIGEMIRTVNLPIDVFLFDDSSLKALIDQGILDEKHLNFCNLNTYAGVRNCGLIASAIRKSELTVMLDDDEEIIDDNFFQTIRNSMRLTFNNEPVDILAGHYVYGPERDFYRDDPHPILSEVWPKFSLMNKAFRNFIGRDPRFKTTPFAFGGNMVLNDTTIQTLPFDPAIPRGEDIDYVLMARRKGLNVILDKEIRVLHNPPAGSTHMLQILFQDMVRFAIERKKLEVRSDVEIELKRIRKRELQPYPGKFVSDDLDTMISETSELLSHHYRQSDQEHLGEISAQLPDQVKNYVGQRDYLKHWLNTCSVWQQIMADIAEADLKSVLGVFHD